MGLIINHPKSLTVEQARLLYQDNGAAHDFDHVLRVLATAERIGRVEGADMEILHTATLLHDVARADQERTGLEHAAEGAKQAETLLQQLGAAPAFVEAVCHAITTHRFRINNPPRTLEAKILYDADKLDAIGAVGMARVFAYGGHVNRPLWAEDNLAGYTSQQEFRQKLVKVKDKLFTEMAQQIAKQRHAFMLQFVEQLSAEIKGAR